MLIPEARNGMAAVKQDTVPDTRAALVQVAAPDAVYCLNADNAQELLHLNNLLIEIEVSIAFVNSFLIFTAAFQLINIVNSD